MRIRKMTPADTDQVCAIEQDVFSDPWSRQGFLDALAMKDTCYLVAEEAGRICGYCGYYRSFEEADIVNVAVAPERRRQKIGRAMLLRLIEEGLRQGVRDFTLEVRVGNKAAVSLYRSLGFRTEGIRKGFYDKPKEDAYLMWLRYEDLSGSNSH